MTKRQSNFLHLADHHAAAVAQLKNIQSTTAESDQAAVERARLAEVLARSELIHWQPSTVVEAQSKFLYVAQFLVSERASLNEEEMASMLESVQHLTARNRQ